MWSRRCHWRRPETSSPRSARSSAETVDMPHAHVEVPSDNIVEESRSLARALLSEHQYDVDANTGLTHHPRMFYHGDDTIAVFDVDLSGTDPRHFGGMSGRGQRLRYLHPDKDWPDGDYLHTLRVHSGTTPS